MRQKEEHELRLVVELKWKENKILKHETTPPTHISPPSCFGIYFYLFINIVSLNNLSPEVLQSEAVTAGYFFPISLLVYKIK